MELCRLNFLCNLNQLKKNMRTALRIFGILVILFALLFGTMSIWRAQRDKDDLRESRMEIVKAEQSLSLLKEEAKNMTGESKTQIDEQIATAEEGLKKLPSESVYTTVQMLLGFLVVISLILSVFLFRPNLNFSRMLLVSSVVLLLAAYFASPNLERGEYSGLPSRTLALLTGIPVVIAAVFAFLIAKNKRAESLRSGR
jgi:uncharacterized membrane protein YidH (DUF202 family)